MAPDSGKGWPERYAGKIVTVEQAIRLVKPGDRIFIHSGCSEPQALMAGLVEQHQSKKDIEIVHFLSINRHGYIRDKPETLFRHNAFFIGTDELREAVNSGHADYTPLHLSEIPAWFRKGRKQIDVALIQVSPPDRNGFCSFGVNVDVAKPLAESADLVIAEVNPRMPRTLGDSFIHASRIHHFVEHDAPLLEIAYRDTPGVAGKIAEHVAGLIENESTLQIGIGRYPYEVLKHLDDKRDLGVHSHVLFDGMVPLVDSGVVTCAKKTLHRDKIVAGYCLGTKKLFDFVDDNPFVEFHPSDYTANPFTISRNDKMVAVNGALTVDLLGQVNSDSIGNRFYSGVGGVLDFSRGAAMSKEGKPILVLPSTTRDGEVSRILPYFGRGDRVTLSMADVHYVVTEWGVAYLHGKSIRERVMAMISIAHPKFRQWLLEEAKCQNYVYSDQILPTTPDGEVVIYPAQYETNFTTRDGRDVFFRPVKPTDERLVQELYYSLDDESRIFRFFRKKKYFEHQEVQVNVNIDYEGMMALIGIAGDPHTHDQEAVALCSYLLDKKTNMGDIAFTVRKEWRNQGLTKFMLRYLIRIAREKGLTGFTGDILWENKVMAHIIKTCGYVIRGSRVDEDWVFNFRFDERMDES
ncbi:MAG: GNAT family N-acetyltransferase [Promethearchaeota archaeon]